MGPLQRKVLMVLQAASHLEGQPGLTPDDIARVISDCWGYRVGWGSVLGAMSGMVNTQDRRWIRHDGYEGNIQTWDDPKHRLIWITSRGRKAILREGWSRKPHPSWAKAMRTGVFGGHLH